FVFGPATLVTGWRPMVLVTTPPHPASKARMMLLSDSVGGADDSRNGLVNFRPVNVTEMSGFICRIIGKAKGMSTVDTHVLGETAAPGHVANAVARDHADRRVAQLARLAWRRFLDALEEVVPAKARKFLETVAG